MSVCPPPVHTGAGVGTGGVSPCWDFTPVLPSTKAAALQFKLAPNFHDYVTLGVLLPSLLEVGAVTGSAQHEWDDGRGWPGWLRVPAQSPGSTKGRRVGARQGCNTAVSRNQMSQHQGWALATNSYLRDVMNSVTVGSGDPSSSGGCLEANT